MLYICIVIDGQVQSPVIVCEENEVAKNTQLYEIKQRSFAFKLKMKYVSAITSYKLKTKKIITMLHLIMIVDNIGGAREKSCSGILLSDTDLM